MLTSLDLAGLHLETTVATVASIAARAATDGALIPSYHAAMENRSIARAAFRAELERATGLPADLIERRLSL